MMLVALMVQGLAYPEKVGIQGGFVMASPLAALMACSCSCMHWYVCAPALQPIFKFRTDID